MILFYLEQNWVYPQTCFTSTLVSISGRWGGGRRGVITTLACFPEDWRVG